MRITKNVISSKSCAKDGTNLLLPFYINKIFSKGGVATPPFGQHTLPLHSTKNKNNSLHYEKFEILAKYSTILHLNHIK